MFMQWKEVVDRLLGNFCGKSPPLLGWDRPPLLPTSNASLGRRLMEAVLERAKQRGFMPSAGGFHNRSLSLYTKLGFDVQELVNLQGSALELNIPVMQFAQQ